MRSLGLVLFACLVLAGCSTQRQTVGTAAGVAAGAVVAGPVRGCGRRRRGRGRDRSGLLLLPEPLGPTAAGPVLIEAEAADPKKAPRVDLGGNAGLRWRMRQHRRSPDPCG